MAAKFVLSWSRNLWSAEKVDQQFREYATLVRLFGAGRGDPNQSQISSNQLFARKNAV